MTANEPAWLEHQYRYRQRTFERACIRLEGVSVLLADDIIDVPKRIDGSVDEIDRGARLRPSASCTVVSRDDRTGK